jgi:hypothetical protein
LTPHIGGDDPALTALVVDVAATALQAQLAAGDAADTELLSAVGDGVVTAVMPPALAVARTAAPQVGVLSLVLAIVNNHLFSLPSIITCPCYQVLTLLYLPFFSSFLPFFLRACCWRR